MLRSDATRSPMAAAMLRRAPSRHPSTRSTPISQRDSRPESAFEARRSDSNQCRDWPRGRGCAGVHVRTIQIEVVLVATDLHVHLQLAVRPPAIAAAAPPHPEPLIRKEILRP